MDNQTIIVKKIKKGGHAHHGGAWKVAFADFVTAMMAFFMLLWLLSAATKEQKQGISSYFIDPIEHETAAKATTSMIDKGGAKDAPRGKKGEVFEEGSGGESTKIVVLGSLQQQQAGMASLEKELQETIENSKDMNPFKEQLLIDITEEGLRIQVVDKKNRPMFDSGSAHLKHYTQIILRGLAKVIQKAPNKVSLTGHTDAVPFLVERQGEPYTNWELSADRANASRRELIAGGLSQDKVVKVIGLASTVPLDKGNPLNPINRRIAIIILNKAAEEAHFRGGRKIDSEEESQTAEVEPVRQKPPAPVVEKKAVAKKPENKKSPAVELAPPRDDDAEGVIPFINPIQLPKVQAPVVEEKAVASVAEKKAVAKKPENKKSLAVELGPLRDDDAESVIPLINPIQLPEIPGS